MTISLATVVTIEGWADQGIVVGLAGRTVEVLLPAGKVSVDIDKVTPVDTDIKPPQKLSDMPLTGFDTAQAISVIWAALDRLELDDDDQDQLNTAMAWVTEACEEYPG